MKKTRKKVILIIIVIIIISLIALTLGLVFYRKIDLPDVKYTEEERRTFRDKLLDEYDENLPPLTKKEYRQKISAEMKLGPYLCLEVDLPGCYGGYSVVILRTILMDNNLSNQESYCLVFTHEAMHMKKFHPNEKYINFESFKCLYESDDIYLHNAGVKYGINILRGRYTGEEDCKANVIDYLSKK